MKKIWLIFLTAVLLWFAGGVQCSCPASQDIAQKHRQTKEKIRKLKWLENVETSKLYKNQQKLENAKNSLATSKNQLATTRNELADMELKLFKAVNEYKELNNT